MSENNGRHEIQRLLPRHFRIMELYLEGWSNNDIAHKMEMTPQAISQITNSPIFQNEVSRKRELREKAHNDGLSSSVRKAREIIEGSAAEAAQTQCDLLTDPDPSVRQKSAVSILDRVFGKDKDQGSGTVINIQQADFQVLQQALCESGITSSSEESNKVLAVKETENAGH